MMSSGFKLTIKQLGNTVYGVFIVSSMGEYKQVAMVEFPNDGQTIENYKAMEEISKILHKRIRNSI